MRKIILGLVGATVVAAPIAMTATSANAAVTYDANSVGRVDKQDVQDMFGWNNGAFQDNAKTIKFTSRYQMDSADVWSCSDGSTQSRTSRVTQSRELVATPVLNGNGKQILGFDLKGINEAKGGTYLSGTRFGAPYVGYCSAGAFTGFLPHVFENTVLPGVQVNGVDLPVTPVAVPVA